MAINIIIFTVISKEFQKSFINKQALALLKAKL